MKVAFNILRLNWYRVLSPLIDMAMKRGHLVECWHNASAVKLGDNKPQKDKVPNFKFGTPKIVEYTDPANLIDKLHESFVDVLIDCRPLDDNQLGGAKKKKFLFVLVGTHGDFPACVASSNQLESCDLIINSSEWVVEKTKEMLCVDLDKLQDDATHYTNGFGRIHRQNFQNSLHQSRPFKWSENDFKIYEDRKLITGNPILDVLSNIDRNLIRSRWGIPSEKKVVVLLPCPYDMQTGLFFGDFFMASSILSKLLILLKYGEIRKIRHAFKSVCDERVVCGIRKFCDNNNAILIAKLRHSRDARKYIKKAADIIISDDSFYPHSALEVFSIADLTVGFYTTGALEAVAASSSYLNVNMPFFPTRFRFDRWMPIQKYVDSHQGVTWSIDAEKLPDTINHMSFKDFSADIEKRSVYLRKYAGEADGKCSERILYGIEKIYQGNACFAVK